MDLLPALRRYAAHEWLVLQKACCRYTNNREKLLRLRYKEKFGREPKVYDVVISDGARKLR